jgi:hypothetical protein
LVGPSENLAVTFENGWAGASAPEMQIMPLMWPPAFGLAREALEALFVIVCRCKNASNVHKVGGHSRFIP